MFILFGRFPSCLASNLSILQLICSLFVKCTKYFLPRITLDVKLCNIDREKKFFFECQLCNIVKEGTKIIYYAKKKVLKSLCGKPGKV